MGYADRLDYEQHGTFDDPRERLEESMRVEIECASAQQFEDLIGECDAWPFAMRLLAAIKDDPEVPSDHPIAAALDALIEAMVQRMADKQEKLNAESLPRRRWY